MDKAPAVANANSNKIVTLARRVFPVTSGSFRTFTENGDHGAKVMRNNSNTASKAAEMSARYDKVKFLIVDR